MKLYRTRAGLCGCASLIVMSCAGAAHAESAKDARATSAGAGSANEVGEIIVTAQKRSENIQKIGASIDALGANQIHDRGITDLRDLNTAVPNLNFASHDGGTFITIRGVGASVDTGVAEPSVATYVDGVFLPRSTMGGLDHQDLASIEILRGPQGTLYGRNATGGAINFISVKPSGAFGAGVDATIGNFGLYSGEGYITGPITPDLSFRLSGGAAEGGNYVKDVYNGAHLGGEDNMNVRGAVSWRPSANLSIDFSVLYSQNDGNDAYQQPETFPSNAEIPPNVVTVQPWRVSSDFLGGQKLHTLIIANTVNWTVNDDVRVRSITGYIHHTAVTSLDGEGTSSQIINLDNWTRPSDSISQEFDFLGDAGRLKWLVGTYVFYEDFTTDLRLYLPFEGPGIGALHGLNERTISAAIFTDDTVAITNRFRIVGGLRYNFERKDYTQDIGSYTPTLYAPGSLNVKSSENSYNLLPKIGVEFDFAPAVMGYAHFQVGYKSGGENADVLLVPYKPERLDAYEIGLKSKFLDNRMLVNLSAFHYEYSNYQVLKVVGVGTTIVENADARMNGAEAEVTARVTPDLKLNASATWLDAKFTKFNSADPDLADPNPVGPDGTINLAGKELARSPPYTASLGLEWTTPLRAPGFDRFIFRGDVFASSAFYLRPFNLDIDRQSSYVMGNVSVTLPSLSGRYQIRLFGTNIGSAAVKQEVLYVPLLGDFVGNYQPPAMYGVEVSARF